jgi:hypothetical protein
MGGGTGTGAAPIIAQVSKELGILTVAVVTKPFELEGKKRMKIAQEGIKELVDEVDSLITIPNQKLLEVLGEDCTMLEAFKQANDVLGGAVRGISDIIVRPGLWNVDFADVKTVMSEKGTAMMGTGSATGPDRARIAAEHAVSSKLLEDISLKDAKGVLVNITAGDDLSLGEIQAVIFTRTPFASFKLISSRSLLETACSAAILALSGPVALPVPIIAVPFSDMTVLTSAKSTFQSPGLTIISDIPLTAPPNTSLACLKASSIVQSSPKTSNSFWLGMVIKESTSSTNSLIPS